MERRSPPLSLLRSEFDEVVGTGITGSLNRFHRNQRQVFYQPNFFL